MRFLGLGVIQFLILVALGGALTWFTAPAVAVLDQSHESAVDGMLQFVRVSTGLVAFLLAGFGFFIGFAVWYALRGHKRLRTESFGSCIVLLLIPVIAFLIPCAIKPLSDLLLAFGQLAGSFGMELAVVGFSLASLILHFLTVLPFGRAQPEQEGE